MNGHSPHSSSRFDDVLRRGDPAGGDSSLTPDERGRIRSHLSRVTPGRSAREGSGWLVPAVAAVLGCVLLVVTLTRTTREQPSSPAVSRTSPPTTPGQATPQPSVQQIRFITPSGTQIVWLLKTE